MRQKTKAEYSAEYLDRIQILEEMTTNPEKGSIFKIYDSLMKKVCVRKLYRMTLDFGNLQKIAALHEKLQRIQRNNPAVLQHTAEIHSVFWVKDEQETNVCITESFIPGETVWDKLREKDEEYQQYVSHPLEGIPLPERGFSEDEVIQYMLQICDCLSVLHRQTPPIIHRDLKPTNLMITDDGNICKIIDFETAREVIDGKTEDTVYLGTKGYLPPEQKGGHQSVPASDIYALGVVMHKMLVGLAEHDEVSRGEDFSHAHSRMNYNGRLRNIILKCTQSELNDRYHDAEELKQALLQVHTMDGNTALRADSEKRTHYVNKLASNRKERRLPVIGGVLVLCGIAILIFIFSRITIVPAKTTENAALLQAPSQGNDEAQTQDIIIETPDSTKVPEAQTTSDGDEIDASVFDTSRNLAYAEPPYTGSIQPVKYVKNGVLDLLDYDGQYVYLTFATDNNGDTHYYFCTEGGKQVDITHYYAETDGEAHLVYDSYRQHLYLVTETVNIYLFSDEYELALQYTADPDENTGPWSCAFFSDGRMFCGANGTYVDTNTWVECGTAARRLEIIANDIEYATREEWPEDYYQLDSRGKYVSSYAVAWSADTCPVCTDGETLFRLCIDRIHILIGDEWQDYTERLMATNQSYFPCVLLSKTDYGFLYYDDTNKQITIIKLDNYN